MSQKQTPNSCGETLKQCLNAWSEAGSLGLSPLLFCSAASRRASSSCFSRALQIYHAARFFQSCSVSLLFSIRCRFATVLTHTTSPSSTWLSRIACFTRNLSRIKRKLRCLSLGLLAASVCQPCTGLTIRDANSHQMRHEHLHLEGSGRDPLFTTRWLVTSRELIPWLRG